MGFILSLLWEGWAVFVSLELVARDAGRAIERGDAIIVIDVLRCTSTIVVALANGARSVLPVKTVEEARRIHRSSSEYVLAGERRGVAPRGFLLGNSPLAFTKDMVSGRDIILTTTSGTASLTRVRDGRHVLVGALLNAKFGAQEALKIGERVGCGVTLALSGKKGSFSLEDFLGAGAILDSLHDATLSDAAQAALLAFRGAKGSLYDEIKQGSHAKYLASIGLDEDVRFCSQLNKFEIVPLMENHTIVPMERP